MRPPRPCTLTLYCAPHAAVRSHTSTRDRCKQYALIRFCPDRRHAQLITCSTPPVLPGATLHFDSPDIDDTPS